MSISGTTLEQFADLMAGLGYKGEKAERPKVKAAEVVAVPVIDPSAPNNPIPEEVSVLAPVPAEEAPTAEDAPPEMEVYYTFTWAPKPRNARPERAPRAQQGERREKPQGARPQGDRPQGDRPQGERPQGERPQGGRPQGDRSKGDRPQGEQNRGGGKPYAKGKHGKPDRDDKRNDKPRQRICN